MKKGTLAQVLSCEFCEIFENTFFIEHLCWLLLKDRDDLLFCVIGSPPQMFFKTGVLKGTVMQIKKALINDRLRVSKISSKHSKYL